MSNIITRSRVLFIVLLFVSTAAWAATPACDDNLPQNHDAHPWERWELEVPSTDDYLVNFGNPTRDVKLTVTFKPCDGGSSFTTFGFWAGLKAPAGKDFRIRGAFPPGTSWQWELSCTSPGAPHDCTNDTALHGRKGRFRVAGTATKPLYKNGFLKVVTKPATKPPYLAFTKNDTPFFWLGDTVWNAHVLMGNANDQDDWATYLRNRAQVARKNDQFTVLQLAVGPHRLWTSAPSPFQSTGAPGCAGEDLVQPGPCVRMKPDFWAELDKKIQQANDSGLVVVLSGIIEPISDALTHFHNDQVTTSPAEARRFAESIAGRYAGNFVIFSPGFDHKLGLNSNIIEQVGAGLNLATTRQLITNHTAGASNINDYLTTLQRKAWLDFQLFQSGTPGAGNGETDCAGMPGAAGELCNLTTRAERFAEKISQAKDQNGKKKPAINGESTYPGMDSDGSFAPNHTPYRARQAAYLSMLAGATGYTMGTCGVIDWDLEPGFAGCTGVKWNVDAPKLTAESMKALRFIMQSVDWKRLMKELKRIDPDQTNVPAKTKMMLAYDGTSAVVAYLPNEAQSIKINFGQVNNTVRKIAGLGDADPAVPALNKWPAPWKATWLNPRTGACSSAGEPLPTAKGVFTFTKPDGPGDANCEQGSNPQCRDWVLRIKKNGTCAASASSAIVSVEKSALDSGGNEMTVWQTTDSEETTTIFGRIVDSQGGTVRSDFVIATGTPAFPGQPSVTALPNGGDFVVAWSGSDENRNGPWIRTQRYSRDGEARPAEFAFGCDYVAGDHPEIVSVGDGGYAIAWEMADDNGIQVLQIDENGKSEAQLERGSGSIPIIETLTGGTAITVNYGLYDERGVAVGGGDNVVVDVQSTASCPPPPLANDDAFDTVAGQAIIIGVDELLGNDAPGITLQSVGSKCQLTPSGRACRYTPEPGFAGTDSFSYTVTNASGQTGSATVTITVIGTQSGNPVANPDNFTVEGDRSRTITSTELLANDSPGAAFGNVSDPVNGTVSCTGANPATCVFTPFVGFRGTASFKYSISLNGQSATGTVTITVTEPPPPLLQASFDVSCGPNAQHPQDSYRTCRVHITSTGSITRWLLDWGDGTPVLEPASGDHSHTYAHTGNYNLTHTVYDATGRFRLAQRAVLADTPPIAVNDSATTNRNIAVTVNVLANDSDPDGDPFSLTGDPIILPPFHGSALPVDGSRIEYTPDEGYVGPDQFTYEITDTFGVPASAVVTISVTNAGPRPPVARNDQAKTKRDTPVTINLLENDADPDGQTIWLTVNPIKTPPRHGTVTVLSQTSVRYTPDPQWGGNDVFEYQIADATGEKDRAWVAVHVGRTRSLPVALDDTASTLANRAVTIDVLENDSSPDGDPITLTRNPFLSKPLHGRVSRVSDSRVSYTPQADWTGTDTFAYEISDSEYGTAAAFVTVTVTSENRPPVANADSAATTAGVSVTVNVVGNDTDLDGDRLELIADPIAPAPQHGTATRASATSITYTPAAGYTGTDTFGYAITDGHAPPVQGTVTITISAATTNHPPEAVDDEAATTAGAPVTIEVTANDYDIDGDSVSLISNPVTTPPANGTAVKVNGSSITYTPRSGFSGTDRFEYEIGDHNGGRSRAWVDVTVGAGTVNHNPVAVDDEFTMLESTTKDFIVTANDSDPDGDPVSLISNPITFPPAHGTATRVNNTTIRYTPTPGYVGMDTLQYEIGDGRGKRSRAWMRVMVRDANSRPVAVSDEASTTAGTAVTVNVTANDSDPDGDVVKLLAGSSPIITPPEHGTATKVDADRIKYTPQAGFGGTDRFQYEINDGRGGHHRAWVNITVSGGSSAAGSLASLSTTGVPPLAGNDATEAFTDTSVAVVVLSNDLSVNGRQVVLTANPIVTPPLYGTAQRASDTTLTYTPSTAFRGNDRLEYEVVDSAGVTTTAWVTVQIPGDNNAPVAVDDATGAAKDGSVTITPAANDTDENGDALVLTLRAVVAAPQNGTVRRVSDTQLLYVPSPGFTGDDTFVYEITDRRGGFAQANVVVHVIGGALAPVALDDSASVQSGKAVAVNVVANDSDPDGDAVHVVASLPPQHGTILWSGGTVTYQSHSGYVGTDSFTYTVNDPTGLSAQGTVSITVSVLNRSTIAANDSAETKTRTPVLIGVLANDYDPDPQRLTVASITQPAHGTVAISNDRLSVTYTPANNFAGNDAFQYTVSDGHGAVTASAAVTVVNHAPIPHSEILAAPEDTWVGYHSYNVLANDVDPDGDELHIVSVEQPAHGQFLIAPDSSQFSYKSKPDWSGMDSFYYTVSDPFGAQVRVLAQIGVSAVNDAPVANDDAFNVYKNQTLTIAQSQVVTNDTDVEGHQISVYSVGPATNGTTRMLEDGSIEYKPYGEFVGTDSFEYTAQDSGGGAYATARIVVTVLQDTVPTADFTVSCNGFACAFDASASTDDRGIVSYQWLLKTGAPSSTPAAGKTFTFTYPSEGVFEARLTVEDVLGQRAVAVKWVTICAPPGIASPPASQTIFANSTATLSVTASGTGPFSYQWYEGAAGTTTTPVGTNSSSFTTPGLTTTKSYWVRVTSTCSGSAISVSSNAATVTVCQLPGIATQPVSKTINAGATATLTVVASGSGPFTYQWYDAETNALVGNASTFTTPALTATKSYWVRVTSTCNGSSSAVSSIATVTVCDPPVITTHPEPKLINAGAWATLSVAASGSGPFTYQWFEGPSGTTTTPVGTNSDTFTTPPLASTKSYWARVTSACNGNIANSNAATVTVCSPPSIATQPASKTIPTGSSTTLTVAAGGSGPFSYQWYEGTAPSMTTPVGTNSSSFTTPVLTANKSYWVRVTSWCNGSSSVNSATATITMGCATAPSISASPTSRTVVAGQSTTLSVTASGFGTLTYQWYQGTAPSTATPVGTNSSSLTVTPGATTNYWVQVSNACGGTASATATVTICNPPVITAHPASTTINYNATATLSVVAGGTGPFSYQWYEGASGVTTTPVGTNSASFTTPPLAATKSYWVRVSNACSTNSNAATVTVNGAVLARRQFAGSTANSQLTITTNWTQPTQAGTLLVAIVSAEGSYPIAEWAIPAGWQHAVTYEMTNVKTSIYYYPNNPGGRTAETFGTGGSFRFRDMILQLAEYTGVVAVSPLDKTAFNGNTSNDGYVETGYTAQTSQAKELVITALTSHSMTEFYGPSQGFVELDDRNQGWGNLTTAVHEKFVTTASSWGHYTQVTNPGQWVGLVATFKAQ